MLKVTHQCLKCLTLVKSSETPYLLQHSIASLSLMLPPGSAITPMPASHASSTASFQAVNRICMLLVQKDTSTAVVLLANGYHVLQIKKWKATIALCSCNCQFQFHSQDQYFLKVKTTVNLFKHHYEWCQTAITLTEVIPKGKNASLAKAAPLTSSPAFLMDILKLSKRFGCPLPMPSIQLFCPNNDKDEKFFGNLSLVHLQRILESKHRRNTNLCNYNGIALNMLRAQPCKLCIMKLTFCWRLVRHNIKLDVLGGKIIWILS